MQVDGDYVDHLVGCWRVRMNVCVSVLVCLEEEATTAVERSGRRWCVEGLDQVREKS